MATRSKLSQQIIDLHLDGKSTQDIAALIPTSADLVDETISTYKLKESRRTRKRADSAMANAALRPQSKDPNREAYVAELEAKVARLSQQLVWAQRGNPESRSGGTLTLFRTDDHHGDRAHLISCRKAMSAKFLTVVEQYAPDKINILIGGDWVAGRGIYKEQQLDSVTSHVNEQVQIGAVAMYDFIEDVFKAWGKDPTQDEVVMTIRFHRGNHDFANGHEIVSYLHLLMKEMCRKWKAVKWYNEGIRSIQNLADTGTYNVLVTHGTGHSQISPTSPAFWNDMKDTLIDIMSQLQPHQSIRRVLHGHTHFANVGMERIPGFFVDTGGGCQRNERVKLNLNKRPLGWIVYVSPLGYDSILEPLSIQPDVDTVRSEMNDPHLAYRNTLEAGNFMLRFSEMGPSMDDLTSMTDLGVLSKEGRW